MELDADVQSHLMETIKANLADHDLEPIDECPCDNISCDESVVENKDNGEVLSVENGSNSTTTAVIGETEMYKEVLNCLKCKENEKELERVTNELSSVIEAHNELEMKLRAELAQQNNKLVDSELLLVDKDEQIGEHKSLCSELKNRIEELEVNLKRVDKDCDQVRMLQDQIDILRPKAEKLEKTESQLEKLRDKIEELKDVKVQLVKEQTDHQQTFSRLVVVEKEVENLQKAKTQLDEYR